MAWNTEHRFHDSAEEKKTILCVVWGNVQVRGIAAYKYTLAVEGARAYARSIADYYYYYYYFFTYLSICILCVVYTVRRSIRMLYPQTVDPT